MSSFGPLRALLICPDAQLRAQAEDALASLDGQTHVCHSVSAYPSGSDLARSLRTFSPHFVLLSFERPDVAVLVMRFLESEANGLPVIALDRPGNLYDTQTVMRESMRAGAREYLTPPFSTPQLAATLQIVRGALRNAPLSFTATDHIYSFLPAKPGVGATTVAMNTSAAFARVPGMKVLLTDLDLACGMIRFLWKLPQDLSIVDALARADEMDAALWPNLVSSREGVDVLHSGTVNPHAFLEAPQVQGLIDFARANYNALFFDLSGNFERHSIQVMQESKRVFVVCNPDAGSLFLAHERIHFLRELGLEGRVSVILNRADQDLGVPAAKVQSFLRVPIVAHIPDAFAEIHRVISAARSLFPPEHGSVFAGSARPSRLALHYIALVQSLLAGGRQDRPESAPIEIGEQIAIPV